MGIRAPNLFTRKLGKSLGPAPLQVHITWTSIHPGAHHVDINPPFATNVKKFGEWGSNLCILYK